MGGDTRTRGGRPVLRLRVPSTKGLYPVYAHATDSDPPGFRLEDRSTQRNLNAAGREPGRKIGAGCPARAGSPGQPARARAVPSARAPASPVCRSLDPARLAFGRAEPWWPLLGGPRPPDQIAARVRQIHEVLGTVPVGGNLILVTHFVTVQDATGERPQEGELVVFTPRGHSRFTAAGLLAPGGLLCDPRLRSC